MLAMITFGKILCRLRGIAKAMVQLMLLKDEVRLKNSKMQLKAAQRNAKSKEYLQQSIRSAKESERTNISQISREISMKSAKLDPRENYKLTKPPNP